MCIRERENEMQLIRNHAIGTGNQEAEDSTTTEAHSGRR